MISRHLRFHGYNSLRLVYRHGQTVRGPMFAVKVRPNPRRGSYRAAVVVTRKVNKSAVARNRIRRRLYEAVRLLEPEMAQPFDIVINVFNDQVLDEPYTSLKGQLKRQLKAAGVIPRSKVKTP